MPRIRITHLPKAQVGTQVGDPDDAWIRKILQYESTKGSSSGGPLSNFGYNNWQKLGHSAAPTSIDEAVNYFKQDYLPKVQQYPIGMRERMADYMYNTGRSANDLLLYNAGKIDLNQLNSKQTFDKEWQQYGPDIQKMYSDPNFINKLDDSKDAVYKTTKQENGQPNSAYEATWKGRLGLFPKVSTTSSNPQIPSLATQPIIQQQSNAGAQQPSTATPPFVQQQPTANTQQPSSATPGYKSETFTYSGYGDEAAARKAFDEEKKVMDQRSAELAAKGMGTAASTPTINGPKPTAQTQAASTSATDVEPVKSRFHPNWDEEGFDPEQHYAEKAAAAKKQDSMFNKIGKFGNKALDKVGKFGDKINPYLGIVSAGVNIYDNYRRQKDYDQWARNSNLSDNYYAVNTNTDRGDYDINNGMFRPNEMGYKSKGTQANAYYAPNNFMRNGGMLPHAQEGVQVPFIPRNFVPEAHVDLPMIGFMPQIQTGSPFSNSAAFNNYSTSNSNDNEQSSGDIKDIIAGKESGGDYKALAKNKDGTLASSAVGKYQFLWNQNKDWIGKLTGITTKEDFRNNPQAQEKAFDYWDKTVLTPYAEKIKKDFGVNAPMANLKYAVHYAGPAGAYRYFEKGIETRDAFGSTVGKIMKLNLSGDKKNSSSNNNPSNNVSTQQAGDYLSPLANFTLTSGYGHRSAPKSGASTEHNGVDLGVDPDTKVFAPMDGVVKSIYSNGKGGNQLIIQHIDGSKTGYAHLNSYNVNIGDRVTRGQVVALSGNTGNSTGPHLHFTYRNPQGVQMDPNLVFNFNGKKKKKELGGQNNNNDNMKIRIVGTPDENHMAGGGQPAYSGQSDYGLYIGQRNLYKDMPEDGYENTNNTVSEKPESQNNPHVLEAEDEETIKRPDGSHMVIKGKRHTNGGVKLNKDQAPEGSFIYSDTAKMKIKDSKILKYFGKSGSKALTPAAMAKQYDTNKFRAILNNPNTDPLQKNTAKRMLDAYDQKLAELALLQESKKGFPNGIPDVAKGYAEKMGLGDMQQPNPEGQQEEQQEQPPMQRYGGGLRRFQGDINGSTVPYTDFPPSPSFPKTNTVPMNMGSDFQDGPGSSSMSNFTDMFNRQYPNSRPVNLGFNFDNDKKTYDIGVGAKSSITNGKVGDVTYNASASFPKLFGDKQGLNFKGSYGSGNLNLNAGAKMPLFNGVFGVNGGYSQNFNKPQESNGSNDGFSMMRQSSSSKNNTSNNNINVGAEWNGKIGKTNVKISGNYGTPVGGSNFALGGMPKYQGDKDPSTVQDPGDNLVDPNTPIPSWLTPWYKAKTEEGRSSPSHGISSEFDPADLAAFQDNYRYWRTKNGKDFEGKTDRDKRLAYQKFVYDDIVKNNPYAYRYIGEHFGTTKNSGKRTLYDDPKDPNAPYYGKRDTYAMNSWRQLPPPVKKTPPPPSIVQKDPPVKTQPDPIYPGNFNSSNDYPPYAWTQQDMNNVGAAGVNAALIKKYTMQSRSVDPTLPEFIPVDWRGQAAALQSSTNAAANQLGAYLPGQSMASNLSSLAGQQAENLGKVISGVDQYNAQGATNMDLQRATMLNQASQYNAGKRDYDRDYNNTADARYRAALAHALDRVNASVNQGITNAGMLYDMNVSESPDYYINPRNQKRVFRSKQAYYDFMNKNSGGYQAEQNATEARAKQMKRLMDAYQIEPNVALALMGITNASRGTAQYPPASNKKGKTGINTKMPMIQQQQQYDPYSNYGGIDYSGMTGVLPQEQ